MKSATMAVYEAASTYYKTIAAFVTMFYQGALHRDPSSTELSQWTLALSKAQGVRPRNAA